MAIWETIKDRGQEALTLAALVNDYLNIKKAQDNLDKYIKQYNISTSDILLRAQETTPWLEKIDGELNTIAQALYEIKKSDLRFNESFLSETKKKINSYLRKFEGWGFWIFNIIPNALLPNQIIQERLVLLSIRVHLNSINVNLKFLTDEELPDNQPSNNKTFNKTLNKILSDNHQINENASV